RQANGQIIRRRPEQRGPAALLVAVIEVLFAKRRIIDVPGDILVIAADAQRQLVADRQVDDGAYCTAIPSVADTLAVHLGLAREFPQLRRGADELQEAAFAVGTV